MLDTYPDVLRVSEVADILRVTQRSVYQYIHSGAIRSFRLKAADGTEMSRVFIPKEGLIEYMRGEEP